MLEEMKAIEENETWQLIDPPPGYRLISLKWVYKVKQDELGAIVKHKACLVVRGFVQREGITFEDPREDHWAMVKQLLRYVKGTVDQGIIFPKTGGSRL
jgi:hypothetical protein